MSRGYNDDLTYSQQRKLAAIAIAGTVGIIAGLQKLMGNYEQLDTSGRYYYKYRVEKKRQGNVYYREQIPIQQHPAFDEVYQAAKADKDKLALKYHLRQLEQQTANNPKPLKELTLPSGPSSSLSYKTVENQEDMPSRSRSRGRSSTRGVKRQLSPSDLMRIDTSRSRTRTPLPQQRMRSRSTSSALSTPGWYRTKGGVQLKMRPGVAVAAASSKSAGFLKTKKAARKNALDIYAKKGAIMCTEVGGEKSNILTGKATSQCVWLGHSTYCESIWQQMICYALIKALFNKAGIMIGAFDQYIPAHFSTGGTCSYTMILWFKVAPGDITQSVEYTWDSKSQVPNALVTQLTGWLFNATDTNDQEQNISLSLHGRVPIAAGNETNILLSQLDLTRARVHLYVKQSMKIQNRTINTNGNDETDDVDNVPLYGRSYEGPGNGALYYPNIDTYLTAGASGQQPITASVTSALIAPNQNATTFATLSPMYKEPPLPSQLTKVSKAGKLHLDPGQIKTSVITLTKSYGLQKLVQDMYAGSMTPGSTQERAFRGNYRVFAVEKMIQNVATSDINQIRLAYELDSKYGCYISNTSNQKATSYVFGGFPL